MPTPQRFIDNPIEAYIRFGLILLLAIWCYELTLPFLVPTLWGLIIAVALFPLHSQCTKFCGGSKGRASLLLSGSLAAALLVPSVMMANSAVDALHEPLEQIKAGTYQVPDLPEDAASWPVVGKPLVSFWGKAQADLPATLHAYQDKVRAVAAKVGGTIGGTVGGILQFTFSIIIAGIFWVHGQLLLSGCNRVAERLFASDGPEYVRLTGLTIKSVALGVIGVATIQAVASAIGMVLVGVPAAGLWALLILVLAVAQLPPLLVLGPVCVYVFNNESSTVATAFLIFSIVVSVSDAFLKPMLLGRGVKVPMIVILIGAIGGMMAVGILGLFIGAITLAVAYELARNWVLDGEAVSEAKEIVDVPQESQ